MSKKSRSKKEEKSKEIFPRQLFKLLEQSDTSGYSHIVSWLPYGHAFKIHDKNLFKEHVMNEHFDSNFESFKRQLYMHGFEKAGKNVSDSGAYFHEHFIRGQLDSCNLIKKLNKSISGSTAEVLDRVPSILKNLNCNA